MVTRPECIRALQDTAKDVGGSPTKAQYEESGRRPSSQTITRKFGSWNEAKKAAGLRTFSCVASPEGRILPKPPGVEIPEGTEWEALTPQQRWYYKNRDHRIEVKNRRRKKLKRWLYEYKRDRCSCERCGVQLPHCLDFHHPNDKEAGVSEMINHGYSKESIISEIAQCTVLCANCHQREHHPLSENISRKDNSNERTSTQDAVSPTGHYSAKRNRRAELRQWVFEYKRDQGGCVRCNERDPVCLEFHHVNEHKKKATIGQLIVYQPTRDRLMEEIEKCELVCRNCHRLIHNEEP